METKRESKPGGRRRFFKFAGIGAAFAALGAGLVGRAHAHMQGMGHGPMDPAKMEERLDRMLKHLYVEIDATEAQKAKIGPIVKQAAKEVGPLREKFGDTRKQAVALLTADKVDRAAIEKLRAEKLQMADQVSKRITVALSDVAEVLTPEQRKKLAEHAAHSRWHR